MAFAIPLGHFRRSGLPGARRGVSPGGAILALVAPLARARVAGLAALCIYLALAALAPHPFEASSFAYFNYLADAFLHGQLHLRLIPAQDVDLVFFRDQVYLYWPPFPALVALPLVAIFGVGASDIVYTAVLGALSVAALAKVLESLDATGIAPLDRDRRALLVATTAFGSVLFTLSPHGSVWITAQIIGWLCVLGATLAALRIESAWGYFLAGLCLSGATATRLGLLFTGLWLAFYMLRRDWSRPLRDRATRTIVGLAPIVLALALLGWYNVARFGAPLEMGLAWHKYGPWFAEEFARYGVFNLHYLWTNLYHQFIVFPYVVSQAGIGSGVFWMTPMLLGAPYALWRYRAKPLIWALALTCLLVYIPIGLVMGTGYLFGSRYLLDLLVPLLVLTAMGIRTWRLSALQALLLIGFTTFFVGNMLLILYGFMKTV